MLVAEQQNVTLFDCDRYRGGITVSNYKTTE